MTRAPAALADAQLSVGRTIVDHDDFVDLRMFEERPDHPADRRLLVVGRNDGGNP